MGAGHPVVDALVVQGAVTSGPLGLGLDVDTDGAVLDATGRRDGVLWAVGPLRRGRQWETTAVPELRGQAQALAASVLGETTVCQRGGAPSLPVASDVVHTDRRKGSHPRDYGLCRASEVGQHA